MWPLMKMPPVTAVAHRVDVLAADHLDPFGQPAEVRVFGQHAAEIVPHADDDGLACRVVDFREGMKEVLARAPGPAEPRPERTAERATQGRGTLGRQARENAEQRAHQQVFPGVAEPSAERRPDLGRRLRRRFQVSLPVVFRRQVSPAPSRSPQRSRTI